MATVVGLLSKKKIDPNVEDFKGNTPLRYACSEGHLAVVRVLVSEFKADLTRQNNAEVTAAMRAAAHGRDDVLLALLCDYNCPVNDRNRNGWGILHYACMKGNISLIQTLICDHNADINAQDNNNNTPFDIAILNATEELVLALTNLFNEFPTKQSLLHSACQSGNVSLARTLINVNTEMMFMLWIMITMHHLI